MASKKHAKQKTPEIIEVDPKQVEAILNRIESKLDPEEFRWVRLIFQAYVLLGNLIQAKNTTLGRLRKMLFGSKTEKTAKVVGASGQTSEEPANEASPEQSQDASNARAE